MIDIEVEDDAWTLILPEVEAVVRRAAEATLSSPPLRGRGRERGEASSATLANVAQTPPTLDPSPSRGEGSLTILLTDDDVVRRLNAEFRGKDAATNVLSFPAPETARPHIGDIVLAYGVCAREAEAQGKPLSQHLMHLTAHGVLHLFGYDHLSDEDAEVMEDLEREILGGLGVPDPYAPSTDDDGL